MYSEVAMRSPYWSESRSAKLRRGQIARWSMTCHHEIGMPSFCWPLLSQNTAASSNFWPWRQWKTDWKLWFFSLRAVILAIPILPFWQISLAAYCFKSFHVHFHRQTSWNFVAMSAKIPNFIGNCSSSRGCPGKILPIYLAFSGVRCDPQVRKSAANREQGLHWFSTVKFWGTDQLQSAMFQLRLEIEAT